MRDRIPAGEAKSKSQVATSTSTPLALFGPPQLICGEDATAYDELLARIRATITPVDIIEEMFVIDVADLEWEVLRWRRLKVKLIQLHAFDYGDPETLAGELGNIERVDRLTTIAENRRNAALREIERHRATFGETLRRTVQEIHGELVETIELD